MYLKKKEREALLEAEANFVEFFKEKEEAFKNDDDDYYGADTLDGCVALFREYLVKRGLLKEEEI
ncbi:hypothetical protein IGM_02429 [Bacillus cereus HuB4-4]|uniref:Uncharacterized protein n=1 Tax=Bacillus cereus HuB4-4 TaxID=1053211 RepID=A0A9W5VM99_BACCE|nr:hypothetical protein [Bacillus cereus]EOP89984.1 hypothetical protein IGM_02429 [Bacillus cereus HuB4-4]